VQEFAKATGKVSAQSKEAFRAALVGAHEPALVDIWGGRGALVVETATG
jgi:hypothetical protein